MSTRFPRAVAIIPRVFFLAGLPARADGLTVALIGVGLGAAVHAVSHAIGQDLGGTPSQDIPLFGAIAVVLLAAGALRWRNPAS